MTNHERHLRDQFVAIMARNYGPPGETYARRFMRIVPGIRRHEIARFDEQWCGPAGWRRPFTVADLKRLAGLKRLARKYALALIAETGKPCTVTFCTDVRGSHLKVHVPDQSYNSFGGVECGMCVP